MSRPLAEVEAEAALVRKHREAFDRIVNENLSAEEERLARETLSAASDALDALRAKAAPPPPPPAVPNLRDLSPAEAAKRAAEIRARPEYFSARRADGTKLSAEEHATLAREHSELLTRAAEEA